jgi:uncharacterized cupredoxin-like copper-binding protein
LNDEGGSPDIDSGKYARSSNREKNCQVSRSSTMKKYLVLITIVFGLALALSACGGGGPSTNIRMEMTEFMFNPASITVPAGQEITLNLSNNGADMHDFIIMKYGTDVGTEFGEEDRPNVYWETKLEPGTSGTYTFTAPDQPGEYQIVCGVAGHYQAGMVAKMIVK